MSGIIELARPKGRSSTLILDSVASIFIYVDTSQHIFESILEQLLYSQVFWPFNLTQFFGRLLVSVVYKRLRL